MPEQRSVLTTDAITSILNASYGLTVSKVSPLAHGSANCFRVSAGDSMYFLKEYQSRFTESELIQFAFWRTDICRGIFQKREEISDRLRALE